MFRETLITTRALTAGLLLLGCSGGSADGGALDNGGASAGGQIANGGTPPMSTSSGGRINAGGSSANGNASGAPMAVGGSYAAGGRASGGGSSNGAGGSTSASGAAALGGSSTTEPNGGATTGGQTVNGGATSIGGSRSGGATSVGGSAPLGGSGSSTGGTGSGGNNQGAGGKSDASVGGATNSGGTTAVGGSSSSAAGGSVQACGSIASTATRPQLTSTQATNYTASKYLSGSDGWDPTSGIVLPSSPTYTVAADGSGTHKTVQAALSAIGGSSRVTILVKAGTYREKVSYSASTPVTLYGADSDASKVVIVYGDSGGTAGGTSQSSTFTVNSAGFQAKNLTISNDFDEVGTACSSNCQAVALTTNSDKVVLENVRLLGNQDTACFNSTATNKVARVYVKSSFIQGDTDYIFGRATVVIESSELHYTTSWKPTNAGRQIAPSTAAANTYGYLIVRSRFTADANTLANKIYLGRAWDEGVSSASSWVAGTSPNGQAVIRECELGAHIRLADPWAAAATSSRAFVASVNRLFEYCNTGGGAGQ